MAVFRFELQSLLDQRHRERLDAQAEFGRRKEELRQATDEFSRRQHEYQSALARTRAALDTYQECILDPERWPDALPASERASRLERETARLQQQMAAQQAIVMTQSLRADEAKKVLSECRRNEMVLEKMRERAYDEFLRKENDRLEAEREDINLSKYASRRKPC
jgi:hypothetical protein